MHTRAARLMSCCAVFLCLGAAAAPVTPSWEPLARGSQPSIAHELEAEPAEKTIVVRALPRPENPAARRAHAHWIARTIVIPALVGAIAGLIALL